MDASDWFHRFKQLTIEYLNGGRFDAFDGCEEIGTGAMNFQFD